MQPGTRVVAATGGSLSLAKSLFDQLPAPLARNIQIAVVVAQLQQTLDAEGRTISISDLEKVMAAPTKELTEAQAADLEKMLASVVAPLQETITKDLTALVDSLSSGYKAPNIPESSLRTPPGSSIAMLGCIGARADVEDKNPEKPKESESWFKRIFTFIYDLLRSLAAKIKDALAWFWSWLRGRGQKHLYSIVVVVLGFSVILTSFKTPPSEFMPTVTAFVGSQLSTLGSKFHSYLNLARIMDVVKPLPASLITLGSVSFSEKYRLDS
eukprot:TRINITY_DN29951_c0_g1_i1.p1 TRINITY_DN29951_c0_g1~~TRINITY_DN29951_c0_g1_i1.p1  ORF type:complete len:269 (+),score=31.06 TRINITY_DN29951_c0_g1_i1:48-854(+)